MRELRNQQVWMLGHATCSFLEAAGSCSMQLVSPLKKWMAACSSLARRGGQCGAEIASHTFGGEICGEWLPTAVAVVNQQLVINQTPTKVVVANLMLSMASYGQQPNIPCNFKAFLWLKKGKKIALLATTLKKITLTLSPCLVLMCQLYFFLFDSGLCTSWWEALV